ncbi:hypothetical protein [Bacillus cereus]|uniref:Uncharacterized protein n=1 Tax=Bacillus cereus TaxID=1396 RepID=A0A2A8ZY47_BACCE|nr:hypothetical protein [Bacillus cereus]PFE14042.1 hypothetical protein CN307_17580 [Bacillus cereus]
MGIKSRVMIEQSKLWSNFEMCTRDFKSLNIEQLENKEMYVSKVKHLDVDYIEPYMIYIIFVQLLEFEHGYKTIEKVMYEIPFQYQEHYCMFSMEKFGLKLIINTTDEGILKTLFRKIKSAAKIAEKLLNPIIAESIDNGDITIENQSGILRQKYLYFRGRVEQIFSDNTDEKVREPKGLVGGLNSRIKLEKEIVFNTQAMLDAYFSFQEHLLILLLVFTNIDFKDERITILMNSNWTEKFNKVFLPAKNPELMKHFDTLKNLKEIRNKYAHGGFEKGEASILAHVRGVGAIPVELPSNNEELFSFTLIKDINFKKICESIDAFENYLSKSDWSKAIKILEGGIDVRFDKGYITELKIAIDSDENLESFLYKESYMYDQEANMDW